MVTGVAVNAAAARLEQLAEPGQTLVAERTVPSRRPGSGSDDLGLLQLRGKEEHVHAFSLLLDQSRKTGRAMRHPRCSSSSSGRSRSEGARPAPEPPGARDRRGTGGRPARHDLRRPPESGRAASSANCSRKPPRVVAPDPPRILVGRCLSYGDGIALLAARRDPQGSSRACRTTIRRDTVLEANSTEARRGSPRRDAEIRTRRATAAALALHTPGSTAAARSCARLPTVVDPCRASQSVADSSLRRRRGGGQLVVVVEDIHWADPVSPRPCSRRSPSARPGPAPPVRLPCAPRADGRASDLGRLDAEASRPCPWAPPHPSPAGVLAGVPPSSM